jgi:hypothetical protein
MGVGEASSSSDGGAEFTRNHVLDKELVIRMLSYEENISKSPTGQDLYKNPLNRPLVSLFVEHTLNRMTLHHFGFSTSDSNVEMFRTIFRTYYESAESYDKDVLNAVHYMRGNKCVYYRTPPLKISELIPNCTTYDLDGKSLSLHEMVLKQNASYTVLAPFSLS